MLSPAVCYTNISRIYSLPSKPFAFTATSRPGKSISISESEFDRYYELGRAGDEKFKDFAEFYYDEYVKPGSNAVQNALEKGIPLKTILKKSKDHFTREDYDFWRQNNFLKKSYEINMEDKEKRDEELKKEILGK